MKITIQPKDFKATPDLLEFVIEKTRKIFSFYDRVISCDVVLKSEKSDKDTDKICSMRLVIPGNYLLAGAQCSSFEEAIMHCVEIIKRQLNTKKSKQKSKATVGAGLYEIQ